MRRRNKINSKKKEISTLAKTIKSLKEDDYETDFQRLKDELAIKCGKRITKELLHNTDDRANLIAKMLEEEE